MNFTHRVYQFYFTIAFTKRVERI